MKLVIDAGSTKMDWVLMDGNAIVMRFQTDGFNPNYSDANTLVDILHNELPNDLPMVNEVCYYGSGCGALVNKQLVQRLLEGRFPKSMMEVGTDMLGAARALFKKERGIACILGTGTNACVYDGETIVNQAVSLGYLVGDEGSGCYIGRKLARAYFYHLMPKELERSFQETYHLELKSFIDRVYHQPEPSKYLADFTRFAGNHQDSPFIRQLVEACFNDFIEAFVLPFEGCHELSIGFVGSVAYHFQGLLQESLEANHFQIGLIVPSPIDGLLI